MKIGNDKRKTLRLLCFLLSALLMMTVSAAVYNYMYLEATPIVVKTAKVIFANGTDADAAGTVVGNNGTYVRFTSLSGWPNATRVYENATVIKNIDDTMDFACELSRYSWNGPGSIDELYIRLFDNTNTYHSTVQVHGASNSTTFTVGANEVWRVEWVIKWSATALSTDSVSVTLALRVTGEGIGE